MDGVTEENNGRDVGKISHLGGGWSEDIAWNPA
jgi:hypothetical protein